MAQREESTAPPLLPASNTLGVSLGRPRTIEQPQREFPALYAALRALVTPAVRHLFSLSITGQERLPTSGPAIIAANHHNFLDGVVLGVAAPRPIAFLVMPRVWRASPLHPAFHRRIGSIPVNLARPDPRAVKSVLRALGAGRVVGIFPEGPFSREGRLVSGQPGVALLALRSGAPVVPVAVQGTFEALRDRRFYVPRRHPVAVRFGQPISFPLAGHGPVTRARRQEVTRRIMHEIAALLGAETRGTAES